MHSPRLKAYLFLIIVVTIWGLAGPVIKLTLNILPPDTFLLYRFAISSIIALVFFIFGGFKFPRNPKTLVITIIYGLITSALTLGLLFWGTSKTSLLEMSVIQSIGPLVVVIAGAVFLKEKITKREKIGSLIAFMGSLAIVIEPLLGSGQTQGQILGNILVFLSLLTNAISAVLLKKLLRLDIKPFFLSNLSFILGFFGILPLVISRAGISGLVGEITNLSPLYHLGVFYMAIFSGTIAYTLGNIAQKSIEISEAALFSYLHPIISAIMAVIVLKDIPSGLFVLYCLVIASGVVIAEIKKTPAKLIDK